MTIQNYLPRASSLDNSEYFVIHRLSRRYQSLSIVLKIIKCKNELLKCLSVADAVRLEKKNIAHKALFYAVEMNLHSTLSVFNNVPSPFGVIPLLARGLATQ